MFYKRNVILSFVICAKVLPTIKSHLVLILLYIYDKVYVTLGFTKAYFMCKTALFLSVQHKLKAMQCL